MFHAIATDIRPMVGPYEAPTVVGIYESATEAAGYCAWENERSDYSFFYVVDGPRLMTFEHFQASGVDTDDIGSMVDDESLMGSVGRVYYGLLYIEHWQDGRNGIAPPNGPTYLLTLGNEQPAGDLEALERQLYDWAMSEDYFAQDADAYWIAHRFADAIEDYCGDDIEAIRAENATLPDGVCASHDYCDANMPMAEAFESVTGRLPIPMSDADAALWSQAWDIAKRDRLTARPSVAVKG